MLGLGLLLLSCAGRRGEAAEQAPPAQAQPVEAPLERGQLDAEARPTIDALVDDFIAALAAGDKQTLTQLRITEREYLDIIIPGNVPVGSEPRHNSPKVKDFFWRILNGKSDTFANLLLHRYGGRKYTERELSFSSPIKHFAWYAAHGEVRLKLTDEDGNLWTVETGSVAEVAGKFKFIGYEYD
jgi:hypothetical protein